MGSCNITLRARVAAKRKTRENMVNIRIKPVIYLFLKTDENQKKKQIKVARLDFLGLILPNFEH